MAKIITQMQFTDYNEIEILGDLERLSLALAGMDDEKLMRRLEKRRKKGRNDYPLRVMWNLTIAKLVFGHNTVASFRRELLRNAGLRKICGLNDHDNKKHLVPPHRVFSGFYKILASEQEEIDTLFEETVSKIREALPAFGEVAAGDGKFLGSYAKRTRKNKKENADNRSENDAEWAVKKYEYTDKNGKNQVKIKYIHGFKVHIICDVKTELPISYKVTSAKGDERQAMAYMLDKLPSDMTERIKYLLLDKGYDATGLIRTIKKKDICPIVDIRNMWKDGESTKQYKNTNIVYDYKGNVYYTDAKGRQRRMNYKGYDKQKKCLRYSFENKIYKIYISTDERIFLPVARNSKKFEKLYRGRTSVERLNGRLDRDFMFENHCIRGLKKMNLMVSLTLLTMNSMAYGKIQLGAREQLSAFTKTMPKAA